MLFNSFQFLVFFPVVAMLYFATPQRFRWALLLAASYYFYMCWRAEYAVLLVISTLIDYTAGLLMERCPERSGRRKYLIMSLCTNFGLLFGFKYFNFFNSSLRAAFNNLNIAYHVPMLNVLLPVGISFYTFQTLSYTIDVYRGERKAERHLGIFALYVAFFPQLVAGPIERSTRLLPQFFQRHRFEYDRVVSGLRLMLWGFFKKVVVADRLALFVQPVYAAPEQHYGVQFAMATFFFAFQIYCDFSAYSDIAIGGARVMGYELMENFRQPYFARGISEFWKRWHISLSTWFRDYLYIPLGGNRVSHRLWVRNICLVFTLSGLWHGANWTFVVWGALHGFYFLVEHYAGKWAEGGRARGVRVPQGGWTDAARMLVTFAAVCVSWIFFRAASLGEAWHMLTHLHTGGWIIKMAFREGRLAPLLAGNTSLDFCIALASLAVLLLVDASEYRGGFWQTFAQRPRSQRWAVYYGLAMATLLFGEFSVAKEFIYFQF